MRYLEPRTLGQGLRDVYEAGQAWFLVHRKRITPERLRQAPGALGAERGLVCLRWDQERDYWTCGSHTAGGGQGRGRSLPPKAWAGAWNLWGYDPETVSLARAVAAEGRVGEQLERRGHVGRRL